MRDAVSAVDLVTLAAAGNGPGALWQLDGEDLQANLIRLGFGDRIHPHRNDEVEVLMVVVAGRGELTLDGQVHPLAPMALVHVPKGTVRAVVAVDALAYLSIHRRRSSGLQVGRQAPHPPPTEWTLSSTQHAEDVTGPYDVIVRAEAHNIDELGKLVVARVQAVDGITRTLTCPVVHL
jgi:quercetin dioxygenase-like cupin family protein